MKWATGRPGLCARHGGDLERDSPRDAGGVERRIVPNVAPNSPASAGGRKRSCDRSPRRRPSPSGLRPPQGSTGCGPAPRSATTSPGFKAGVVTDVSGSWLSRVRIWIASCETGLARQTTTSERGEFFVSLLQPGDYDVTAEAPAFSLRSDRVSYLIVNGASPVSPQTAARQIARGKVSAAATMWRYSVSAERRTRRPTVQPCEV